MTGGVISYCFGAVNTAEEEDHLVSDLTNENRVFTEAPLFFTVTSYGRPINLLKCADNSTNPLHLNTALYFYTV